MSTTPLILAALLAAGPSGSLEQQMTEYDQGLLRELEAMAPAALDDARAAADAYRERRWQESFDRYGRVLEAAPRFSHALRRQCTARLHLGDRASAVPLCRRAVALAPLPENRGALARALSHRAADVPPTAAERAEAGKLARETLAAKPGDASTAATACDVSLRIDDTPLLRSCTDVLLSVASDDPVTRQFAVIAALTRDDVGEARAHLARARAVGLEPEAADALERLVDESEPLYLRYGRPALLVFLGWAAGLLLLLAAGVALSALTLRAAGRMAQASSATSAGTPGLLRRVYATVLTLCCAYYYVSVPLVLAGVLALGGAAIYGLLSIGRVPLKLLLVVAVVVLVSVWAVLKAIWASLFRPRAEDPGERIPRGAHPRLDATLEEVARRIGTRPVDTVFLTPGTDVAVFEKGSVAKQLAHRSERCLILGAGVLDGMTQGELKAILAHEYGHFVNRDTAGGGLALAVRRSVQEMAITLAQGGAATWYSPAWWFVRGFHRVFLRVSQGASRLQEILADRWAALAYGGRNFARGLRHVVERAVRFDRHAEASLKEVIEGERALANLYRYEPTARAEESSVAAEVEQALAAEPSPYDSHPCPRDRIAWAGGLGPPTGPDGDDTQPAWGLFSDREAVERQMTALVRAIVEKRNGVTIPESPPAAADSAEGAQAGSPGR